ncbi:MAG: HEAT repeat domain-containing protein [Gemmataceae bacterium]
MRTSLWLAFALILVLTPAPLSAGEDKEPQEIGGKTLEQWIKEIKSPDPAICENAIRTVILFGKKGAKAAPALIDQLNHRDSSVKGNAAASLGYLSAYLTSADTERAIVRLANRMTDGQSLMAFHSAMALYFFGNQARPVIPQLINASKDPLTWELRRAATMALGVAGAPDGKFPQDVRAVMALVEASKDHCSVVRLEAVTGLGMCGQPAAEADKLAVLAALEVRYKKDTDDSVRIWAHTSYMYVEGRFSEAQLSAIASFLKSPKMSSRAHAAKALGVIGKEAGAYTSKVIDLLEDKEPIAALTAANALPNMGKNATEAIPVLTKLLEKKDLNESLRAIFTDCLKNIQSMKAK